VLAPLNRKGTPVGVICVTKAKGYFTSDDLHFLSILGNNMISDLEIANLYEKLKGDYINSIYALAAAVDAKDHYTHGHSTTVMKYSEKIARAIDLPEWEVEDIKYAALLHDIGKIGISESIINKPAKLTSEEFAVIKMHPQLGANIISRIESLKRLAPLVASHHEWINGTGYPMGLRGDEIPLGGKIISIADAFSTITAKRPYREASTIEAGLKELKRCTGTQFDRDLVEVFFEIMESESDEFKEDIEKERRGHAPEKTDIRRIRVKIENHDISPDSIEKDDEFYS
ncbi:MAG TPA: HD-GYP domain-containing protein, partial [Firmicutes bacterium]|nr:HD-GYP domain-containing protein [Bacillota bacterium]